MTYARPFFELFLLITLFFICSASIAGESDERYSLYPSKLVDSFSTDEQAPASIVGQCVKYLERKFFPDDIRPIFAEGYYVTVNTTKALFVPGYAQKGAEEPIKYVFFCHLDEDGQVDRWRTYQATRLNQTIVYQGNQKTGLLGNPYIKRAKPRRYKK